MDRSRRVFLAGALVAVSGAFAVTVLSSPAFAKNDPIPLIDVVVKKTPPGNAFAAHTDHRGYLSFTSLPRGTYVITDSYGNKARIRHPGGPALWRLVGKVTEGIPVWTLMDDSQPLRVTGDGRDQSAKVR